MKHIHGCICVKCDPSVLRKQRDDLLEALELFMDMWNSGDLRSSKRAQQRRAEMWDKANKAVANVRETEVL